MLLSLILGTAGFLLFFIYDINSITGNRSLFRSFFLIGNLFVALATVLGLIDAFKTNAISGAADIVLCIFGLLSLAAMFYSLFFALPFDKTYVQQENGRHVYDRGVYALCRHPGVLFFFAFYLLAGLAALPSHLLLCGMIFTVYNFAYICFQDLIVFPKTFSDYSDYKTYTPFIIPNKKSICRMLSTSGITNRKEDSK